MSFTQTLSADGQTSTFLINGDVRVHLNGTFGGGTVTLQQSIDGTFEDLVGTAQTADSDYIFENLTKNGGVFRFNLTGSTTPTIAITAFGAVREIS
jgi:hypothetical protein